MRSVLGLGIDAGLHHLEVADLAARARSLKLNGDYSVLFLL